jgi:hypothetical protein
MYPIYPNVYLNASNNSTFRGLNSTLRGFKYFNSTFRDLADFISRLGRKAIDVGSNTEDWNFRA